MAKCCANCFNDKLIISYIKKESNEYGDCIFCGSKNVQLADTDNFIDAFETLFNLYKVSEDSKAIAIDELIQRDWLVFTNQNVARKLIPEIIDYVSMELRYTHKGINEEFVKSIWQEFKEEIKHNNRFFPKSSTLDINDMKGWIQELETFKYPRNLYRARISEDGELIESTKMGKPPHEIVTAGRANPHGISYLYMATTKKTAIAEVRPHKGDYVCIANIKLPSKLRIADLRNPKQYLSPFIRPDDNPETLFKYIELLQHLGLELSKPILPRKAHLEYISSQYLAELIKDSGFDGIIFKSSVERGDNIALFHDNGVEIIDVKLYEVTNLNFGSMELE
jgi:hypothetical protein